MPVIYLRGERQTLGHADQRLCMRASGVLGGLDEAQAKSTGNLHRPDVGHSLPSAVSPGLEQGRRSIKRRRTLMPKYLFEGHYTPEGAKGVAKEGGSGRRDAIAKAAESVGGKLESIFFAFGGVDTYVTVDLPDNVAAAAIALAANQGNTATVKTVVLMTPEEMDKAAKKTVKYRAPGH
jgi:uncharacterized protein with GYD domain